MYWTDLCDGDEDADEADDLEWDHPPEEECEGNPRKDHVLVVLAPAAEPTVAYGGPPILPAPDARAD